MSKGHAQFIESYVLNIIEMLSNIMECSGPIFECHELDIRLDVSTFQLLFDIGSLTHCLKHY